LPRETNDENNGSRRFDSEGFIDEQALSRVIARGAYDRTGQQPAGMALSASGDDYAGWMLPVKSPFRGMTGGQTASAPQRLPLPPTLHKGSEPGIDPAYQGGHRWWLFGMTGALTCGIMALTLFSLAPREEMPGMAIVPAGGQREMQEDSRSKPDFTPSLSKVLQEVR
jgi:hypothetical protein